MEVYVSERKPSTPHSCKEQVAIFMSVDAVHELYPPRRGARRRTFYVEVARQGKVLLMIAVPTDSIEGYAAQLTPCALRCLDVKPSQKCTVAVPRRVVCLDFLELEVLCTNVQRGAEADYRLLQEARRTCRAMGVGSVGQRPGGGTTLRIRRLSPTANDYGSVEKSTNIVFQEEDEEYF